MAERRSPPPHPGWRVSRLGIIAWAVLVDHRQAAGEEVAQVVRQIGVVPG